MCVSSSHLFGRLLTLTFSAVCTFRWMLYQQDVYPVFFLFVFLCWSCLDFYCQKGSAVPFPHQRCSRSFCVYELFSFFRFLLQSRKRTIPLGIELRTLPPVGKRGTNKPTGGRVAKTKRFELIMQKNTISAVIAAPRATHSSRKRRLHPCSFTPKNPYAGVRCLWLWAQPGPSCPTPP